MVTWLLLAPVVALVALIIKKDNPALALTLGVGCGVLMLLGCLEGIGQLRAYWGALARQLPGAGVWLAPLIKCCGVAVLVRVSSEICRDAGEGAMAGHMELCGVVAILLAASPLLAYFLEASAALWT